MTGKRQKYIKQLAHSLTQNTSVPYSYRAKLQSLLIKNKILYVKRALRQTNKGMENVFGTANINTGKIKITSRCWTHWEAQNKPEMIAEQIQKTLLHEVKHLLLRTAGHPGGRGRFDNEFKNIHLNSNRPPAQKVSRLSTIHSIAKSIIANTSMDYPSRVKLQKLLQQNKLLYIKQVFIRNAQGTRAAYSTVRKASQEIIITQRCWTYQGKKNKATRTSALIQQALLHEVKYLL
jgi:hypothetical protein